MELWDVLDEKGEKTGKTIARGDAMRQDEYHLVVHVWIKNSQGEYLITKRTENKTYPNMWETTGGSAISGENSLEAALREVKEEIGLYLLPEHGNMIIRLKRHHYDFPDFVDVWLFEEDVDISKVVYQPDEVCDAKWATPKQIYQLINSNEFVNTFSYLDILFKL